MQYTQPALIAALNKVCNMELYVEVNAENKSLSHQLLEKYNT